MDGGHEMTRRLLDVLDFLWFCIPRTSMCSKLSWFSVPVPTHFCRTLLMIQLWIRAPISSSGFSEDSVA